MTQNNKQQGLGGLPRFRWKLNLGINDRLINSVNLWQMAAHRANVDFRPLFDHHSAVEYATKYATKAEKANPCAKRFHGTT